MDNVFFDFVATYWEDIAAFLNALKDFIVSLIDRINGDDAADAE